MMDRRTFLRWSGGAMALPFLQWPGAARAQAPASYPTRFLVFYQPNGSKKEEWSPSAGSTEKNFTLGPILQPLNRHKDQLVLMDGVNMLTASLGPGGPHQRGMATVLTGQEITQGDFVGGDGRRAGWGGGISIDQHIVNMLQPNTPLGSLELGIRVKEAIPRSRIIYRGSEQPVAPINDPIEAYAHAFGEVGGPNVSDDEMRRLLLRRQSVLDFVHGDFRRLVSKVGRTDQVKLEQHAESLRDLERRLTVVAERSDNCMPPMPMAMDIMGEAEYRDLVRAQIDVMVNAMACDVTRVGSIQCSSAINALRFTFMDLNDHDGHSLSHSGDSNEALQGQWSQMLTWYSEQQAYLLDRLASIEEGEGTLLDNTLVFFINEISRGNTHSHLDMPFMLGGGAGGRLHPGRYIKYDNANHTRLLSAILHLMGIEQNKFGHRDWAEGPLPEVLNG